MISRGEAMIFKVNRPSFQTKSNYVESVLNMRQDIGQFFNQPRDSMETEIKIREFIDSNLRDEEANTIYKKIPEWTTEETDKIQTSKNGVDLLPAEIEHARKLAWLRGYRQANEKLDRYYRIKGNEIRIAVVGRNGYTPEGKEVCFMDADLVVDESNEITREARN